MDLTDLKPKEDAVDIELKHPVTGEVLLNDGDNTPMTISVVSSFSKKYKEQLFNMSRKEMKTEVFKGEAKFEDIYEFTVDFLSEMTTGWNITLQGKKPKFSRTSAKDLYDNYTWIKEQVEEGISSAANVFTKD